MEEDYARLECLKLAVSRNAKLNATVENIVDEAEKFFVFVISGLQVSDHGAKKKTGRRQIPQSSS